MNWTWVPTFSRAREIPARSTVNAHWLVALRWAQIAGQAATIAIGRWVLGHPIPLVGLYAVVAVGVLSNVGLRYRVSRNERVTERALAFAMVLDVVLLTLLLQLTGGPDNPFAFLYLVQIALATVLLRAGWTWFLGGLSLIGFGLLLVWSVPLTMSAQERSLGMWVALGVAAGFIVHFLVRINSALAAREAELERAKQRAAKREHISALATMAAGAAHELATPLSTVALVARELERKLTIPQLVADARLIREQTGRCRSILDTMVGGAGTVGETVQERTVEALLREAVQGTRAEPPIEIEVDAQTGQTIVAIPPRALGQALRALLTNAQDASPGKPVRLAAELTDQRLLVSVVDGGPGMPADVLSRLGEPFFSTKAPGRGMGLGVFLSRAVIEQLAGSMEIDSREGRGTSVNISLPRDVRVTSTRVSSSGI